MTRCRIFTDRAAARARRYIPGPGSESESPCSPIAHPGGLSTHCPSQLIAVTVPLSESRRPGGLATSVTRKGRDRSVGHPWPTGSAGARAGAAASCLST